MRLLICTQKVDQGDKVLAFFHTWIAELAERSDTVKVVCLFEGEHQLPKNTSVFSLGKEKKAVSRLVYSIRFLRYVWRERQHYDTVFVHMNQEYILLAGWLWKLMGKRIVMWRNHYSGTLLTDIAAWFCDVVCCTSRYSYTTKYAKTRIMPVGVDTSLYKSVAGVAREPRSILSLGRVAPSKKVDLLSQALCLLEKAQVPYAASVYGDALPEDTAYMQKLKEEAPLGVSFHPGPVNYEAPPIFTKHSIFVNLSPSGMYDKTIFEAISCGCLPLIANKDLGKELGEAYYVTSDDPKELAQKLKYLLAFNEPTRQAKVEAIQEAVVRKHSLTALMDTLYIVLQS